MKPRTIIALAKKQEALQNDIKQEGRRVLSAKKKEFKRRLYEMEEEIKNFNEKAAVLKEQEAEIKKQIKTLKKEGS